MSAGPAHTLGRADSIACEVGCAIGASSLWSPIEMEWVEGISDQEVDGPRYGKWQEIIRVEGNKCGCMNRVR